MWKLHWLVVFAILMSGCGKPAPTGEPSAASETTDSVAANGSSDGDAQVSGPAAATREFLDALRTGDDDRASKMLTALAREKSGNRNITPSASDTAKFGIGKVEYVNDDGARVVTTWTDLDEKGQPESDDNVWVLRREQGQWRIAGMAAQAFPGEAPLLLNFEDPDDMLRKQQWAREELRRRTEAAGGQAQKGEKQEKSIRR